MHSSSTIIRLPFCRLKFKKVKESDVNGSDINNYKYLYIIYN